MFIIDVLSRKSSSLLCIPCLTFLCHVRVMNVNSICDDNDDAFQRYNFFKELVIAFFIPELHSIVNLQFNNQIKMVRPESI